MKKVLSFIVFTWLITPSVSNYVFWHTMGISTVSIVFLWTGGMILTFRISYEYVKSKISLVRHRLGLRKRRKNSFCNYIQKRSIAKWGTLSNHFDVKVIKCLKEVDGLIEKYKGDHLFRVTKNYYNLGKELSTKSEISIIVPACMDLSLKGEIPRSVKGRMVYAEELKKILEECGWKSRIVVDVSVVEAYISKSPVKIAISGIRSYKNIKNVDITVNFTFFGLLSYMQAYSRMHIPITRFFFLTKKERLEVQCIQIQYIYPGSIIVYPKRKNMSFLRKFSKNPIIG